MKIAFFGTPEFALPSLRSLCESPHRVVGVISAPDKPAGRGKRMTAPPVALEAKRRNLPLLQPENLRDALFLEHLKSWNAEVFAVVAFRILPEEVFGMPRYGAINLHASLLPAYRGAAPINWALWNGEKTTGLTTFHIEKSVDTGNILLQAPVEISDQDDAGSLSQKMAQVGAQLLVKTLTEFEAGGLTAKRQDHAKSSPAPKITKDHCQISWQQPARVIRNQIRALSPEPAAFTIFENLNLKIFRSEVSESWPGLEPGWVRISDQSIVIGTADGSLRIWELQLQGKNRMDTDTFLRGYRPRGTFNLNS